jgi:hypothetical protein
MNAPVGAHDLVRPSMIWCRMKLYRTAVALLLASSCTHEQTEPVARLRDDVIFSLVTTTWPPVEFSCDDVTVQRRGSDLEVRIPNLSIALRRVYKRVALDAFVLRAHVPAGTRLSQIAEAEYDFAGRQIARSVGIRVPDVTLSLSDAAAQCAEECVIVAELRYENGASQSAAVRLQLNAKRATLWTRPPGDFVNPDRNLGGCAWFTDQEIGAVVGRPMKVHRAVGGSRECTWRSEDGQELFMKVWSDQRVIDAILAIRSRIASPPRRPRDMARFGIAGLRRIWTVDHHGARRAARRSERGAQRGRSDGVGSRAKDRRISRRATEALTRGRPVRFSRRASPSIRPISPDDD